MKAIVDQETCIGCMNCTRVCPEVFRMEGDVSVAYADPVPDEYRESCRQAADECPVNAIEIEE